MLTETNRLQKIRTELEPFGAQLIAVSKTKSEEEIMTLYRQGQRHFGENRVQELVAKQEKLPQDIRWHFIGHLQRNKVKYIASFVHLIQSVDSFRLLQEIDKSAAQENRTIDCLLEFKIAEEETKYGFDLPAARAMLDSPEFRQLSHVRILGVMGMATFTDDQNQIRREFHRLKDLFQDLKFRYFPEQTSFRELSMGMSGDYLLALEEGSTMVRIGTLLFGARN